MINYTYSELDFIKKLPTFHYDFKQFYVWQDDDYSLVAFSVIPDIENKLINKAVMSKDEIKAAKKKPLYLKNSPVVLLFDKGKDKKYTFAISKGYDWDGATISKVFYRIIGSREDIRFKIASLIHDFLCEHKQCVDYDRYFADKVFERLLKVADTWSFIRWIMFHSVDNFQKFCNWEKKD